MDHSIDLERLSEVFTDHPWLAEAVSNGAWWGNCDGTVEVVTPVGDPVAIRAGLVAFAEALGCEPGDVTRTEASTGRQWPRVHVGRGPRVSPRLPRTAR